MSRKKYSGPRRPIEKDVITVHQTPTSTSQLETLLYTADDPCTVIRIVGNLVALGTYAGVGWGHIAIVKVDANLGASTLDNTNGNFVYRPEHNVLWHGSYCIEENVAINLPVDVKGMRKLREQDSIRLIVRGANTFTQYIHGSLTIMSKH